MLVKIRHGAELSGAEKEFLDCLRSFPITCFVAVDVHVGDNGTRRIGAVLVTPSGITVAEIKGFQRRQSGILSTADQGGWKISDAEVEWDDETTARPSDQVEQAVYEVKSKLERALLDPGHVCGVAVLVPFRGVVVRPARTNLRPGLDVVVANVPDATELRIYVEGFSSAPRDWTADRVLSVARALGLEDGPTRAELVADGFPANAPSAHSVVLPQLRPKPKPVPGPSTGRQTASAWAVFALALVGVLVVFGVVITAWVTDTDGPDNETRQTTTATTTPAPRTAKNCSPFQTGC